MLLVLPRLHGAPSRRIFARGGPPLVSAATRSTQMTQLPPLTIEPARTAVVIMDFQNGILAIVPNDAATTTQNAVRVLDAARMHDVPVFYVQHRGGRFEADSPEAEILDVLRPHRGDRLFVKTKAGAFSTTGLDVTLREQGRDTMVILGVATSGCVLSTVRWGADVNYRMVVVKDACADADPEVHRVLTEKLFPRQATVVTAAEFAAAF
jgi:nicotinamidase-related amidase